ncbi:MAG: hypothetical protein AB1861_17930 [Cyanobacteriota bacterium]
MRPSKTIVLGVATSLLVAMGGSWMAWGRAEIYNRNPMTYPHIPMNTYQRISMRTYQNFLVNWDERAEPRLYALIRTPKEYDQLFHPAPLMRDTRPFHPEAGLYKKSQLLVVARVFAAKDFNDLSKVDEVFEVERVTAEDGELTLRYRLRRPPADVDADVNDARYKFHLAIQVPKAAYRKVTIIEDGKLVGQLKPTEGLWTVPKPAPE